MMSSMIKMNTIRGLSIEDSLFAILKMDFILTKVRSKVKGKSSKSKLKLWRKFPKELEKSYNSSLNLK